MSYFLVVGIEVLFYCFLNQGTRHRWTQPFYTLGRDLVPIVQETGWSSGLVGMGTDNLTTAAVRTPDHPTCSKSLYWLLSWLLHLKILLNHPNYKLIIIINVVTVQRFKVIFDKLIVLGSMLVEIMHRNGNVHLSSSLSWPHHVSCSILLKVSVRISAYKFVCTVSDLFEIFSLLLIHFIIHPSVFLLQMPLSWLNK